MGYKVGGGEIWLTVGNEDTGLKSFLMTTNADGKSVAPIPKEQQMIKPESLVRIWGTREGTSALLRTLSQMLADAPPIVHRLTIPGGSISSKVEGAAFFEEAGVVHILSVRFENDEPVFEDIGFVAAGCGATVPNHSCFCTASGAGASCTSGSNPNGGGDWAKCKDGNVNSPEATTCTGNAGSCSCTIAPAQ